MNKRTSYYVPLVLVLLTAPLLGAGAGDHAPAAIQRAGLEIEPGGARARAGLEIEPGGIHARAGLEIEPGGIHARAAVEPPSRSR